MEANMQFQTREAVGGARCIRQQKVSTKAKVDRGCVYRFSRKLPECLPRAPGRVRAAVKRDELLQGRVRFCQVFRLAHLIETRGQVFELQS